MAQCFQTEETSGGDHGQLADLTAHATDAVDCRRTRDRGDRTELPGPLHARHWQSEDPRGIRHQRDRDRRLAIGVVDHLRIRSGANRLFPRSAGATLARRRCADPVVDSAGGRRLCRVLCPTALGARRAWRRRVPSVPGCGARYQRLVSYQGSWPSNRCIQFRWQHRSIHRAAAAHRPDAGIRLAHNVHRHGHRRRARFAGVVQAVSGSRNCTEPEPQDARRISRRTGQARARWKRATGAGCSASSQCGG